MSLLRKLQSRWEVIWAMRETRLAFIIVGTVLGVGAFYYPIVKHIIESSSDRVPKDQKKYYDKSNFYPIKVLKQREEESKLKGHLEAGKTESS